MKSLLSILLLVFVSNFTNAQNFRGLDKSPLDMIEYPARGGNTIARILYGRPQLKGRDITRLVPEGQLWRFGANEATELTLYTPMKVNDKKIEAGSYTMFAIPRDNQITIIINSATHIWGTYYDQKMDVVRMTVPLRQVTESLEAFSMAFQKSTLEKNGVFLPQDIFLDFEKPTADRPKVVVYEKKKDSKFKLRVMYLQLVMMAGR